MIYEGKEVTFCQGAENAQVLNVSLKELAEKLGIDLYDFGGNNYLAPSPTVVKLNGKDTVPYLIVFGTCTENTCSPSVVG